VLAHSFDHLSVRRVAQTIAFGSGDNLNDFKLLLRISEWSLFLSKFQEIFLELFGELVLVFKGPLEYFITVRQ
jgi:hypothetical protein